MTAYKIFTEYFPEEAKPTCSITAPNQFLPFLEKRQFLKSCMCHTVRALSLSLSLPLKHPSILSFQCFF
jgi:hypothetical protein